MLIRGRQQELSFPNIFNDHKIHEDPLSHNSRSSTTNCYLAAHRITTIRYLTTHNITQPSTISNFTISKPTCVSRLTISQPTISLYLSPSPLTMENDKTLLIQVRCIAPKPKLSNQPLVSIHASHYHLIITHHSSYSQVPIH